MIDIVVNNLTHKIEYDTSIKNINDVPQFEIIRFSTNCSVLGLQTSVFDSQLLSKMAEKKEGEEEKKKTKKKRNTRWLKFAKIKKQNIGKLDSESLMTNMAIIRSFVA